MAIETIGSMMTAQAAKTQPISKPEYTDVQVKEAAPKVDVKTPVVENVENKGDEALDQKQSEALHRAVEDINKKMNNSELVYGFHEKTNRVTIKIVDKETKEVIRELPPEKTLDMIAKAWEMAGILVDERR